jgi:hypothetical protein
MPPLSSCLSAIGGCKLLAHFPVVGMGAPTGEDYFFMFIIMPLTIYGGGALLVAVLVGVMRYIEGKARAKQAELAVIQKAEEDRKQAALVARVREGDFDAIADLVSMIKRD